MSKKWDYDVPSVEIWQECLRVLKPGGYLLSFASTRTQHRMAINIEDAGFEIREIVFWNFSSGFPKSHNVSCAIDKSFGHPNRGRAIPTASTYQASDVDKENKLTSNEVAPYEPITDEAKAWQGWGTALKPACEPITMARKPLEGTVSHNVLKWGTGAINIDATRVPMDEVDFAKLSAGVEKIRERGGVMDNSWKNSSDLSGANPANPLGRWGANFIHDGSQEVLDLFPDAKGGAWVQTDGARHFNNNGKPTSPKRLGSDSSSGSAARFFYCSKSNKKDRNEGLNEWEKQDLKLELMAISQLIKDISGDSLMEYFKWNIDMFTNNIMDQSLKDLIFIMSMASNLTIELKIYNASQNLNIKDCIQVVSKQMKDNGLNLAENAEHINLLIQNTTDERTELVLGVSLAVLKMLLKINEIESRTSTHPTVKPTDLMCYLVRMVTRLGGTVLDPFMGSGTTGKAAMREGMNFIGCEIDAEYLAIAEKRIQYELDKQA